MNKVRGILKEAMLALLTELAGLPSKVTNPRWLDEVAAEEKDDGKRSYLTPRTPVTIALFPNTSMTVRRASADEKALRYLGRQRRRSLGIVVAGADACRVATVLGHRHSR